MHSSCLAFPVAYIVSCLLCNEHCGQDFCGDFGGGVVGEPDLGTEQRTSLRVIHHADNCSNSPLASKGGEVA